MISMKRSLSQPAYHHPHSPLSQAATNPSRSPSPTPDVRSALPRASRARSRSPVHSAPPPESTVEPRPRQSEGKSTDDGLRSDLCTSVPQKPLVAQPKPQTKSQLKASPVIRDRTPIITTDRPPTPLREDGSQRKSPRQSQRPLLADVSLYTNNFITTEEEGTTLEKLAHEVRLSKYQERKRANTRIRLQRSLISTALSSRLTRCGDIAQRNLADLFRTGDTQMFAKLYDAIQDVRNSCDATRRFAHLEPEMDALHSPGMASSDNLEHPSSVAGSISGTSVTPFLVDLSSQARDTIIHFLTQLRTNPDFLASRLCALSVAELQAITIFQQGMEPIESVLPFYTPPSGRGPSTSSNKTAGTALNAVERLLSFQRHDPLSALIYTSFANSAGPNSAEDKRRTQVWATACSRLIQTAAVEYENVLVSIVNVWAAMRSWSGRSNMEWFIMKILEDGAFLLDRAEDPQGTRFSHVSDWTTKDTIAAEDFYDRAVDELFAIIDDEDATGIPEGVLELGHEILRQLERKAPSMVESTKNWFVYKWLFSNWLLGVIVHPESFGMMAEYNITEYGRQKILKEVAMKAQVLVNDKLVPPHLGQPVSTPLRVKKHIENLVNRFKPSRSQKTMARLLPARSITSLRETAEVHPYLVVSPSDIYTMANALFPERRPRSAHSGSIRSGAPSVSGFSAVSQPISMGGSRRDMDTSSAFGMSVSPVRSEATTSYEPLLSQAGGTPQRCSPPFSEAATRPPFSYEDDGRQLRMAMHEMVQTLGSEVVAGSCHPCAERWAVLFVSPDGDRLSLQMMYDPEDDQDEDTSSAVSETEDESDGKPELNADYHGLRDSILKLVEDFEFEIPADGKTTLSNNATRLKKYRSSNKIITSEKPMGSRNPYRKREERREEPEPVLVTMLTEAEKQSKGQLDFVSAHLYWKTLEQLSALTSPSLRKNGFASLLNIFARGPRDSLRRSASAIEEYDAWLIWLKQSQERHEGSIETMMKRLKSLRDKMWYVTDVRNSEVYEHARHLCSALKIMGVPRKSGFFKTSRAQLARNPTLSFIHKQESQMLGLLAASEDQGGPNKLTDDQVEKTNKWLSHAMVKEIDKPICRGEERIHRLCCEIDNCMGRLVGDSVTANPVLWSSPLFLRDRKTYDGGPRRGRERDTSFGADDAASVISGDYNRRITPSSNRQSSVVRDLRSSSSSHSRSQMSVDSGRYNSFSRASTAASDILDMREYFGVSSPVHSIDSATTFWSPFHSAASAASSATSRAQSPTGSVANLSGLFSHPYQHSLPSTVSFAQQEAPTSPTETVQQQRLSEDKQRFLSDLRQTLLSLLLSDFGNFVYAYGSETDVWFNEMGQDLLERKDDAQKKEKREEAQRKEQQKEESQRKEKEAQRSLVPENRDNRDSGMKLKHRAIEKKRSSINLRESGDARLGGYSLNRHESASTRSHDSAATNETISARPSTSRKEYSSAFPYSKAYERLLRMFSVHPNPYMKLNSLYELERLITASLASGGRRPRWPRSQTTSNDDFGSSGKNDQADRERRPNTSHGLSALSLQARSALHAETRSIAPSSRSQQEEAVRNVLRTLLRDPNLRPKTLFRDLQFISVFVPPSVLDMERNNAYFNTVVAALSLKDEVTTYMVEVADVVIAQVRGRSDTSSVADTAAPTQPAQPLFNGEPTMPSHSMPDVAKMLTIAAKEGNTTAQRELGLFQMSNPELVDRITLPLSKPRDIFKAAVMERFGARSSGRYQTDRLRAGLGGAVPAMAGMSIAESSVDGDVKNDPALMCVAWHWMERAQQGGDELATRFMGQFDDGP
ncbi:hypothetical protein F5Y18DRAFT_124687 [Xylariaceae sp. FL1019]|nr:hypothetical protein F5Y18DRAFT_124687 [Xylariaceae sp. FL1019]